MKNRVAAVLMTLSLAACGGSSMPSSTAPSELGLSVVMSLSPATANAGAKSPVTLGMVARDGSGAPATIVSGRIELSDAQGTTTSTNLTGTGSERVDVTLTWPAEIVMRKLTVHLTVRDSRGAVKDIEASVNL